MFDLDILLMHETRGQDSFYCLKQGYGGSDGIP